jgi:hypothetical protein
MSAPEKPAAAAGPGVMPTKDAFVELAEKIYVNIAARIYSSAAEKKPDPKTLAAMCFKMADAFEQASRETDRAKAEIERKNKAAVKLDEVDLTSVFQSERK